MPCRIMWFWLDYTNIFVAHVGDLVDISYLKAKNDHSDLKRYLKQLCITILIRNKSNNRENKSHLFSGSALGLRQRTR